MATERRDFTISVTLFMDERKDKITKGHSYGEGETYTWRAKLQYHVKMRSFCFR